MVEGNRNNDESIQDMDESDFYSACEKQGIAVFYGMVQPSDSDVYILGANNFLKYCDVNGIQSIILDMEYDDVEGEPDINYEECREKISAFFEKKVSAFPYSYLPTHISKEFYSVILDEVLQKMKVEIQQIISTNEASNKTDEEKDEDEEKLLSIMAYALHEGCRVNTLVYSIDEEEDEELDTSKKLQITQKDLLNKYARIIVEQLPIREKEAKEESGRITKELKDRILGQITVEIRDNKNLISMKTQKSRNEFADRLYVEWKEDKGNDYNWLTKTAIRALVEKEYYHATSK